jgi:alkyl-hydroperoxide reductase/thiol specific antioxidant family protein
VVIGPAKPEHIPAFRQVTGYQGALYADPSGRAFRTAGLEHGWASTYHPLAVLKGVPALARGFRQGARQGDPAQQGGTFVLGPGDRVRYEWRDRYAGDGADLDAVIATIPLESPSSAEAPTWPPHSPSRRPTGES